MIDIDLEFSYKIIDSVVELLDENDFMGVIDLKHAYRSVAVNPDHILFQGLSWQLDGSQVWLIDHRLCFRLKCGPFYFNHFSNFVQRVCSGHFGIRMVNYLDDLMIHISGSYEACLEDQCKIIAFLRFLGFQVSWIKVVSPTRCPTYLDIEIDSHELVLCLPRSKIDKLEMTVLSLLERGKANKKQLERVSCLLSHWATVVRGGRTFCHSVYNLEKVASKNPTRYKKLSAEVVSDLQWWLEFASFFNCKATIKKPVFELKQTSDASLRGFAAFLGEDWIAGVFNDDYFRFKNSDCEHWVPSIDITSEDSDNISVCELIPVLLGLRRWAHRYSKLIVTIRTDNMQVFFYG